MNRRTEQTDQGRTTTSPSLFPLAQRGPLGCLDQMITLESRRRDLSRLRRTTNPRSLCQRPLCPRVLFQRRTEITMSHMADCQKHTCQTRLARSNSMCFLPSHNFPRRPQLPSAILAIPSERLLHPSIRTVVRSSLHPFCLLRVPGYSAIVPTGTRSPGKRALRVSKEKNDHSLSLHWQSATASQQMNLSSRQLQVDGSRRRRLSSPGRPHLVTSRPAFYRVTLGLDQLKRRDSHAVSYPL
jgi:hypothetical protein